MRRPQYCLTHHQGISSSITNTTHFSTPPMPSTLSHRPLYPDWRTSHITYAGTSLTLAHHLRCHVTNASTPLTQTYQPRWQAYHTSTRGQHKQHTISQTRGYPVKLLKLLALKFKDEIQQFLLSVCIFTAFSFEVFLSIFIEFWKTTIGKLNFVRGN